MFMQIHCRSFVSLALSSLAACAAEPADARVGQLDVALSSRLGDVEYHLRDATLRIDGPAPQEVSLDGPGTLTLDLPAGPYRLTLLEGWELARQADGELEPVAAQLLSENPMSLFLGAGSEEQLSFRFALEDGEAIGSGDGTLEIGFELADGGAPEVTDDTCVRALRINEIDYDQEGTDTAELVELFNGAVCDAPLADVALELVNGSNGEVYSRIALDELGAVPASGTLVVADEGVLASLPADVPAMLLGGAGLQNGPDAVRLLRGEDVLDVVGYGEGAPLSEGEPTPEDTEATSLGRCPSGFDTDDNAADFRSQTPSPGAPNDC